MLSFFKKFFLFVAIVCCAQFFVAGIVGVVRGYSIQNYTPDYVFLLGVLILSPYIYISKSAKVSLLVSSMFFYKLGTGVYHGHHEKIGKYLYEQKDYKGALMEFKKECETWYLRLRYNYREASSSYMMAKCYLQLENFDKAISIYERMIKQFNGHYQESAKESLATIHDSLKKISDYEIQLALVDDDRSKSDILFHLSFVYRGIYCNQKAIDCYNRIEDLDVWDSRKEQAKEFARDLLKKK